jgi:thiamine biosynthesis lipoprotein
MLPVFRPEPSRKVRFALVMFTALVCIACQPQKELKITGKTMGTTYHIKVVAGLFTSADKLQQQIDRRLAEINASMSTYDPTSEISRFNAISSISESFAPSDDFNHVLQVATELHRLTEGAWDGTLDPLINLWGFGRKGTSDRVPHEDEIERALAHVGFDRIRLDPSGNIAKSDPAVTLDLASIAKGYGTDVIARLLGDLGFAHFFGGDRWRGIRTRPTPGRQPVAGRH